MKKVHHHVGQYIKEEKEKRLNQPVYINDQIKPDVISIIFEIMKKLFDQELELEQKERKNEIQCVMNQIKSMCQEYKNSIEAGVKQQEQEKTSAVGEMFGSFVGAAGGVGSVWIGNQIWSNMGSSVGNSMTGAFKGLAACNTGEIAGFVQERNPPV